MSQQINLINPALIKQKNSLTIVNIALVYGVISVLMVAWYGYVINQASTLGQSRNRVADALQVTQNRLTEMTAARAPKQANQALVLELTKLEEKKQVQTEILNAIAKVQPKQDKGLAHYMRGFARQAMDGIWLTGFSINQAEHAITVKGRSLHAEALPDYMKQLGQEPVFSGQSFGGLHIQQPEPAVTQASTSTATNNTSTSTSTASTAPVPVPFVDFELQAIESPVVATPVDTTPTTAISTSNSPVSGVKS